MTCNTGTARVALGSGWLRTTAALTSASLSDNMPLQERHTYYVRVRAHDKHCNIGDWVAGFQRQYRRY